MKKCRHKGLYIFCVCLTILAAGITAGILYYIYNEEASPKEIRYYYGSARVMEAGGEKIKWSYSLYQKTSKEAIVMKSHLKQYMCLAFGCGKQHYISITRFNRDLFEHLLGMEGRGVHVSFRLDLAGLDANLSLMQIHKTIISHLRTTDIVKVDLESFEISQKPHVHQKMFKSLESYLTKSDDQFDLLSAQLPGSTSSYHEDIDITCSSAKVPKHGSVSPLGCTLLKYNTLAANCSFTCNPNYSLIGSSTITCLATSHWSGHIPVCKARCPPVQITSNIHVEPQACGIGVVEAGTQCVFSCKSGFVLNGSPILICKGDGAWSSIVPVCKKSCPMLSIPDNGEVKPLSCTMEHLQAAGAQCSFACHEGFVLVGSPVLFCDYDGRWNFASPSCRRGCPPLIPAAHSAVFPPLCSRKLCTTNCDEGIMEGMVCTHSCEDGYELEGSSQQICIADGTWSGMQVSCTRRCEKLKLPVLMKASPAFCSENSLPGRIVAGHKCTINCPVGYVLPSKHSTIVCQSNGSWTTVPSRCIRTCSPLKLIKNGKFTSESCFSGDVPQDYNCSVNCEVGFAVKTLQSVHCLPSGKWSGDQAECLKRCPLLKAPSHGSLLPSNCGSYPSFEGDMCTNICDYGFGLKGNSMQKCLSDGTWSGDSPACLEESQFMIRHTTTKQDICLIAHSSSIYPEKHEAAGCSLENRFHIWTFLEGGYLQNIGHGYCLTAEFKQMDSFLMLRPCGELQSNQVWTWDEHTHGSIKLAKTNLKISYGHASVSKVVLATDASQLWYAVTPAGNKYLHDVWQLSSCVALDVSSSVLVSPVDCSDNYTVSNGTACSFSCVTERKLLGDDAVVCVNSQWSASIPSCIIECPPLISADGTVAVHCRNGSQTEGAVCKFECIHPQHALAGEEIIVCLSSGLWSSPMPQCILQCVPLKPLINGIIRPIHCIMENVNVGTECWLKCKLPYKVQSTKSMKCLSNGSWSYGSFSCARPCSDIKAPEGGDGVVVCDAAPVWPGVSCHYSCGPEQHRVLAGKNLLSSQLVLWPTDLVSRTCQQNGLLGGLQTLCVSVCERLARPLHGVFEPQSCQTSVMVEGSVCTLKCEIGFGVDGPGHAVCQDDGSWSNSDLHCKEETQFRIVSFISPSLCLYADPRDSRNDDKYVFVFASTDNACQSSRHSIWTWYLYNHLKHSSTGLCLSVKESNKRRLFPLILQNCSAYDVNQQWMCASGPSAKSVRLVHAEVYINLGSSDSEYAVASQYHIGRLGAPEHQWMGIDMLNASHVLPLCLLHTQGCPPLFVPHSSVTPSACHDTLLVDVGVTCTVTCQSGYLLGGLQRESIQATCNNKNVWTFSSPILLLECVHSCSVMSMNVNVVVDPSNCSHGPALFGDVCYFHCSSPLLSLFGSTFSVCGHDGQWTDLPPQCAVACKHVIYKSTHLSAYAKPVSCQANNSIVPVGQQCSYQCLPPYMAFGPLSRTCAASGSFDSDYPKCHIPVMRDGTSYSGLSCPPAPPPVQSVGKLLKVASCTLPGNLDRLCAWYGCTPGYKISTLDSIHCAAPNYQWQDPPLCKRPCPRISDLCVGMTEGGTCQFACPTGYAASHGNGSLVCQADGTWSDPVPQCIRKFLFQIQTFASNASNLHCLTHDPAVKHSVFMESCSVWPTMTLESLWSWEKDSMLKNTQSGQCLAAAQHSHGSRVLLQDCNELDPLQRWICSMDLYNPYLVMLESQLPLYLASSNVIFGVTDRGIRLLAVASQDQFDSDDLSWIQVNNDGLYTATSTLCSAKSLSHRCPPLTNALPEGGKFVPSSCVNEWSPKFQECSFRCIDGFTTAPISATFAICLHQGTWTALNFACQRICTEFVAPANGFISCTSGPHTNGTVCIIGCHVGFELIGSDRRVCQWDGHWSGHASHCSKWCPAMPNTIHAYVTPSSCLDSLHHHLPGSSCFLECPEGYGIFHDFEVFVEVEVSAKRKCLENGSWSGKDVYCVRLCSALTNPSNGKFSPPACTFRKSLYGAVCEVECKSGFAAFRNSTWTCSEQGSWTNAVADVIDPVCKPHCSRPPDIANAEIICDSTISSQQHNIAWKCFVKCRIGYGIAPDARTELQCLANGEWSDIPTCLKEKQFFLFFYRSLQMNKNISGCLVADESNNAVKIKDHHCKGNNQLERWSWHGMKLKNAGTGFCLIATSSHVGGQLLLGTCHDLPQSQQKNGWTCDNLFENAWLLLLTGTQLFADFEAMSVNYFWLRKTTSIDQTKDAIRWYAHEVSSNSSNFGSISTVCSQRKGKGVCPPMSTLKNGKVYPHACHSDEISAGMMCTFECYDGYKLDGEADTIMCQLNGLWSAAMPLCSRRCEDLTPFEHGRISPSWCTGSDDDWFNHGIVAGDSCSFVCEPGWKLVGGPSVLTCLSNGIWNDHQPQCKRICPKHPSLENVVAKAAPCLHAEQIEGSLCLFACSDGFAVPRQTCDENAPYCNAGNNEPRGYDVEITLTCGADGKWHGPAPTCQPLCSPLESPANGWVSPLSCASRAQISGSICVYGCHDNYSIRGDSNFTCVDGRWILCGGETSIGGSFLEKVAEKLGDPICEAHCDPIQVAASSQSSVAPFICTQGRNPVGIRCTLHCQTDFVLKGVDSVTCREDGSWSDEFGSCIRKCPALRNVRNGRVFPALCKMAVMTEGTTCRFQCDEKYILDGSPETTCSGNGTWSNVPPSCKRRCSPVLQLYNGRVEPLSSCLSHFISAGERCHFTCSDGFSMAGNSTIECMSSGDWSHPAPTCNRVCDIPTVHQGTVICSVYEKSVGINSSFSTALTWGTRCTVKCAVSFSVRPSATFSCGNDGLWMPELPQCVATGVPMYVIQTLGNRTVCLHEYMNIVEQEEHRQCILDSRYSNSAAWHWFGRFNIRNAASGSCIAVRSATEGQIVRTAKCNVDDPLQQWDCSVYNPFQLVLKGTDLSPSTYYQSIKQVVLQRWSDYHSYYSTFDLATLSYSSLCTRRPGGRNVCTHWCINNFRTWGPSSLLPWYCGVCPPLQDIANGKVKPDECRSNATVGGQVCTYQCRSSAVITGEPVTTCMGNGLWSSPPPSCAVSCEPLQDNVTHGSYYLDAECVFDFSPVGKVCEGFCKRGYKLNGNGMRTCLPSGQWSPSFKCSKTCPAIFGLLNGMISPTPCHSNLCKFTCRPGYVMMGARSNITCLSTGRWNGVPPKCLRDTQFQIILKETLEQVEMCLTVTANFSAPLAKSRCDDIKSSDGSQLFKWSEDGKKLVHPLTRMCIRGKSQRWANVYLEQCSNTDPLQVWECGQFSGIYEYSLRLPYYDFFLDVGARFEPEFGAVGAKELSYIVMETEYLETSQWMAKHYFSEGTVCSMRSQKQCSAFPPLLHGDVFPLACRNHSSIVQGLECIVVCHDGYSAAETDRTVCLMDGLWDDPMPVCSGPYQCDRIVTTDASLAISPVECLSNEAPEGTVCHFSCGYGRLIVGHPWLTCQDQGKWSSEPPVCTPACSALLYIVGASVWPPSCYGRNNRPGSQCKITCPPGHRMLGSAVRSCMSNGLWSGTDTSCLLICPQIAPPSSGNVHPDRCKDSNNFEADVCDFKCNPGFLLVGSERVTCTGGQWDKTPPECAPSSQCPAFQADANGVKKAFYNKLVGNMNVGVGTELLVICKSGFKLLGKGNVRRCLANGTWEGGLPVCQAVCPLISPPKHGFLTPASCAWGRHELGTSCVVRCDVGWRYTKDPVLKCIGGGQWSNEPSTCLGGHVEEELQEPFLIRQYDLITKASACVKRGGFGWTVSFSLCPTSAEQKDFEWRWKDLDVGLIESVSSPGHCWHTVEKNTGAVLGLATCNRDDFKQYFRCDDVNVRQHRLRVCAGDLVLAKKNEEVLAANSSIALVPSTTRAHALQLETLSSNGKRHDLSGLDLTPRSLCSRMCGGTRTSSAGELRSPVYPSSYPVNTMCYWKISVPNHVLHAWIYDLNIEEGREGLCRRDHLQLLDGFEFSLDSANILGTFCGRTARIGPVLSFHGNMLIEFKSDANQAKNTGFVMRWFTASLPSASRDCVDAATTGGKWEDVEQTRWHATLLVADNNVDGYAPHCGALFIHRRYLLTTARCVLDVDRRTRCAVQDMKLPLIVVYGATELWKLLVVAGKLREAPSTVPQLTDEHGASASRAAEIFVHPDYDNHFEHDIALVKLASSVQLSLRVFPLCLHSSASGEIYLPKSYCKLIGWSEGMDGEASDRKLTTIDIPILSVRRCVMTSADVYGRKVNTSSTLCAAHVDSTRRSLCVNESGGALACAWNGNLYAVGIASQQLGSCSSLTSPQLFTKISPHKAWIDERILKAEFGL